MKTRRTKGKRSVAEDRASHPTYGVNVTDTGRFRRQVAAPKSWTADFGPISEQQPAIDEGKNPAPSDRAMTDEEAKQYLEDAKRSQSEYVGVVDASNLVGYTGGGREDRQTAAEIPPGIMPDAAHDLNALAADLDLPFEVARKALQQAKAELTQRETTSRSATATPRPEAAATETTKRKASDDLTWPSEKWEKSDEKALHKHHAIVAFVRRVWKPFIEETGAVVTLATLKQIDDGCGEAFGQYLKKHDMPTDIPVIKTRELSEKIVKRPAVFTTYEHT